MGKEDNEKMDSMIDLRYSKYPELRKSLKNMNKEYNYTCDFIDQLEKEGKIFVIRPTKKVKISKIEKNPEKIEAQYQLGFKDALDKLDELKKYLEK